MLQIWRIKGACREESSTGIRVAADVGWADICSPTRSASSVMCESGRIRNNATSVEGCCEWLALASWLLTSELFQDQHPIKQNLWLCGFAVFWATERIVFRQQGSYRNLSLKKPEATHSLIKFDQHCIYCGDSRLHMKSTVSKSFLGRSASALTWRFNVIDTALQMPAWCD